MNAREVNTYLDSFINYELQKKFSPFCEFKLHRVRHFLKLLGNPQDQLKVIHVAGTNGKGSVCAYLASILREANYSVGLFTSPHVWKINERIRVINPRRHHDMDNFSGSITDEEMAEILTEMQPAIEEVRSDSKWGTLSYFEILTVLSLMYFRKQETDFAILEVGLGGRLDATNVADSLVCVINEISLEHTQLLGETLSQIAAEKAGIIKSPRHEVVVLDQSKEALDAIYAQCKKFDIKPTVVKGPLQMDLPLKGEHQKYNAALSVAVITKLMALNYHFTANMINEGLRKTSWPGRFELISEPPKIIIDSAHNPSAIHAFVQTAKNIAKNKNTVVIAGFCEDKDVGTILELLYDLTENIIITKAQTERALEPKKVRSKFCKDRSVEIAPNLQEAINMAKEKTTKEDVILITGSMYVVGEARDLLPMPQLISTG